MLEIDTIVALAGIALVDTQCAIDVHGFWRDVLEERSSEIVWCYGYQSSCREGIEGWTCSNWTAFALLSELCERSWNLMLLLDKSCLCLETHACV